MHTITAISIFATTLAFTAPPILPFTELSEKKIKVALEHVTAADECTTQDITVLLQLDHIQWKYNRMREIMYATARDAPEGNIVHAKDLGKLFDTMDSGLEVEREKDLVKIRDNATRKELIPSVKTGKDV